MIYTILRTDGTSDTHEAPNAVLALDAIKTMIQAEWVDTVNLRDGRVLIVDDNGYEVAPESSVDPETGVLRIKNVAVRALKPVNVTATALYHAICQPGVTHQLVGDVAVVREADFRPSSEP